MAEQYKPGNYSTVSPYLIVDGARATVNFLVSVFGANELVIIPGESGKVMHAAVKIEDTVVMLADSFPPNRPAVPSDVHIYVKDVDSIYKNALAAGAVSVQEPIKKQDPDKRGAVRDSGGITWWISTKVE